MTVSSLMRKRFSEDAELGNHENPFSTNKVTRYSINLPILGTCMPSRVCADSCYFARGPSTWRSSLSKQHRLLNRMRRDPIGLADQIVAWAPRLRLTFVRWNGGGDLIEEAPACIDRVAVQLPAMPQWIVTRKPAIAARIVPRANVYVHFSVDRDSLDRLAEIRRAAPGSLQWFWSYQCAPGEVPDGVAAAVVFRHNYDPAGAPAHDGDCPLNWRNDIAGTCEGCRRCFNGDAVAAARRIIFAPHGRN